MKTWSQKDSPGILGEMKRRRVYPVMAAYAVIAWMFLQIGEVTFQPLGLPDWVMTALVVLAIIGFPVVFALSWIFDITPEGIRRDTGPVPNPGQETPSVAVLPFADMSDQQDQAHFCEGVAEEILIALTRIPELRVAARSSSFQFRDLGADVRRVGLSLGVQSILEGSVRKSKNHIRVTAELVNVADGYHIWSKRFDAELEDVFAIQDEIAQSIADSLLDTITPSRRSQIRTTSSKDVTAYDYYLRGRQFIKRFSKRDLEHARDMFRHAIDIDPDFSLAWAGYADCHSLLIIYADPKDRYRNVADEASTRAIELDPGLSEAHASRGLALMVGERYEDAEKEFRKAIELNPELFEAYYYYARTRFHQGDLDMAADLFLEASLRDPEDYQSRLLRVQILRGTGRAAEAIREAREGIDVVERHLEWSPDDVRALQLGAGSLILLGDTATAIRWMERAYELSPQDPVLLYNLACNYATLGDRYTALDYLERAADNGVVSVSWLENDEDLHSLRTQPRFAALVSRLRAGQRRKRPSASENRKPASDVEEAHQGR